MSKEGGLLKALDALNVGEFPDARDVTHLIPRTKTGVFTLTQYRLLAGSRGLILWYDKSRKRVYISRAPNAALLIQRSKAAMSRTSRANRRTKENK